MLKQYDQSNRRQEFSGLASDYQAARPSYPAEAFQAIIEFYQATGKSATKLHIADVGCGTGISTLNIFEFLGKYCEKITGVEPGESMLAVAKQAKTERMLDFINGSAEELPFDDASIDIIMAAQAAQWFDRSKFYAGTCRTLKDGGVLVVLENNRDWSTSNFLERYEQFLETYSQREDGTYYSRFYRDFDYVKEMKVFCDDVCQQEFSWSREMSEEDFFKMVRSSTQANRALEKLGEDQFTNRIKELFPVNRKPDKLIIHYKTKVICGRLKRGSTCKSFKGSVKK